MAQLVSMNWTLEVRYFPRLDGLDGIHYEIYFRYKDEPIIRDDLLKRTPKIWENRPPGAFLANENGSCTLVPTLKYVLQHNSPGYWSPTRDIGSDVSFAFYPGMAFPILEYSHSVDVSEDEDINLDDMPVTVIAMVDAYNFGNEFAYNGMGPALILHVKRPVLEQFHDELQAELEVFLVEYGPIDIPPEIKEDL